MVDCDRDQGNEMVMVGWRLVNCEKDWGNEMGVMEWQCGSMSKFEEWGWGYLRKLDMGEENERGRYKESKARVAK